MTEEVAVERAAATGRAVEASLEEFLTFERLLADLSARLANVSVAEVETEIDSALRELQEFLGFDRSNLFEFTADGWATIVCSVSRDAVERHPLGPAPAFLKWYLGQVRAGKIIRVQSIEDLPREGAEQIEYHRRVGIRSSLGLRSASAAALSVLSPLPLFARRGNGRMTSSRGSRSLER